MTLSTQNIAYGGLNTTYENENNASNHSSPTNKEKIREVINSPYAPRPVFGLSQSSGVE